MLRDRDRGGTAGRSGAVVSGWELALEEEWPDGLGVDELGALGLGKHEPNYGEGLEGVVEGEPVKNKVDECLDEGEESVDNPVRQPLDVILGLRRLQSAHREVCGQEEADHVGQEAGKDVEEDQLEMIHKSQSAAVDDREEELHATYQSEDGEAADGDVGLGHIGSLFELDQRRVFLEL